MTQEKRVEVEPKIKLEEELIGQRQAGLPPGVSPTAVKPSPSLHPVTAVASDDMSSAGLAKPEVSPASLSSTQGPVPPGAEEEEAFRMLQSKETSSETSEEPWLAETLAHLKDAGSSSELDRLHTSGMSGIIDDSDIDEIRRHAEADEPQDHELDHADRVDQVDHQDEDVFSEIGMLEMTLRGKMTLKLKRNSDGPDVLIRFTSGYLQISLSDGMEFKIPVKRQHLKKVS